MWVARCCLLLGVAAAACAARPSTAQHWQLFKEKYGKTYSAQEDALKRAVWEENVAYISQHNLEYELGLHTFTLGVNKYADLSAEEYKTYLLGAVPEHGAPGCFGSGEKYTPSQNLAVPDKIDWRIQGYVTPVKDQGMCGSCWSFSSTGAMEGANFKATGNLVSLSEQQLLDCDNKDNGCGGGWMDLAYQYVVNNGGIDTEESYPYLAEGSGQCSYDPASAGAKMVSWMDVTGGDEATLQAALVELGPISVAIDASQPSFQLYKSGIYMEPACNPLKLDHAVLAVGYGNLNGQDFWLVKNSWGLSWGLDGYILMARNADNMCGIATCTSYPVAAEQGV